MIWYLSLLVGFAVTVTYTLPLRTSLDEWILWSRRENPWYFNH